MRFFWDGVRQAWHLIVSRDPYLVHLIRVTLEVAGVSTGVALVLGVPLGLALGLARFRGRRVVTTLANAGLGLPPVLVGLVMAVLLVPEAPLGRLHLLYTLKGVYVAQTILAFPVVVALCAAAVRGVPSGLLDQAAALGAARWQVYALALREARVGVLAAAIAAVASSLSEVGAVVLVGGNVLGYDQTLASATLEEVEGGRYAEAIATGLVLLGLIVVIAAVLTVAQHRQGSRGAAGAAT